MCGQKCLWSLCVVVILVSIYMARVPVPAGFSEPIKLRAFISLTKAGHTLIDVLSSVGLIRDRWEFMRGLERLATRYNNHTYDSLKINDTKFVGVPARVYWPVNVTENDLPAVLFYHGGGFTLGSVGTYHWLTAKLAHDLQVVVISVEYRLAPEHPFPAGLNDCFAVTKYVIENAQFLRIDPTRMAVMGDSSGGNLAAAVTLKLRDSLKTNVKLQVLVYPVLQFIDMATPSFQAEQDPLMTKRISTKFRLNYILGKTYSTDDEQTFISNNHTSREIKESLFASYLNHDHLPRDHFHQHYTPNRIDHGDVEFWQKIEKTVLNPYFSPLIASDLRNLPPAYILTCHVDMLRDDGYLYVRRLKEAGVPVSHANLRHCFHGIISLPIFQDSRDIVSDIISYIKANL